MSRIPLGPETELRIEVVDDPLDDHPMLDLRLCRKAPGDSSPPYPTKAGFVIPLHLAGLVSEAIRVVGARGAMRHAARNGCPSCDD